MKCESESSAECYEMKQDENININHLIAMMAYTNFDTLSNKFSTTYRLTEQHPTIEDMKKSYRNYY